MSVLADFAASLAPSPDRARAAARLTVAVSLVILAVLWLDLPGLDLAAYVMLFTYRKSTAGTVKMGLVFAVLAPVAAAAALGVWAFTADAASLRVAAFALITFAAMVMKEVPGKGMLLCAVGVLTVCIAVAASQAADGDLITRALVKLAFAIAIAGCASAACAGLLWPTNRHSAPPPAQPVPDARSRRAFALRATAATMLGYLAWELTDWYGIHTCMFTALFIASGDVDAAAHRGWLRIAGAVIGSLAALGAIVFIVPELDTVAGLITLVAPVTFVAAWIAAGSDRFAYLGLQFALAFYLALLSGSGPTTNLHEARDRMVGVLLGVLLVVLCLKGFRPRTSRNSS